MANEAKHTPGPWVVALPRNDLIVVIPQAHMNRSIGAASDTDADRDEFARQVCMCSNDRHGRDSHLANATLIAAAPQLLVELQASIDRSMQAYDALREMRPGDRDALENVLDMLSPGTRDSARAAIAAATPDPA